MAASKRNSSSSEIACFMNFLHSFKMLLQNKNYNAVGEHKRVEGSSYGEEPEPRRLSCLLYSQIVTYTLLFVKEEHLEGMGLLFSLESEQYLIATRDQEKQFSYTFHLNRVKNRISLPERGSRRGRRATVEQKLDEGRGIMNKEGLNEMGRVERVEGQEEGVIASEGEFL